MKSISVVNMKSHLFFYVLLIPLLLGSCGGSDHSNVSVSADGNSASVAIKPPAAVLQPRALNVGAIRAEVSINGEPHQLDLIDDLWRMDIFAARGDVLSIVITWFEDNLPLARLSREFSMDQNRSVNFGCEDYVANIFDKDNDGYSNLLEKQNNGNALDVNHPGPDFVPTYYFEDGKGICVRSAGAPEFLGPEIQSQNGSIGQPITPIQVDFSDPDGDTLEYSASGRMPTGLNIDSATGTISGTPNEVIYTGLRITATDPVGLSANSNEFELNIETGNQPPVFDGPSIPPQEFTVNSIINPIVPAFTDPDNDVLTYSVEGDLPPGLTFDMQTGQISGTPTELRNPSNLSIIASDPTQQTARSNEFSIAVSSESCKFTGPSLSDKTITVGQPIPSFNGNFNCPDGTTYIKVGDWPVGVNVNNATGAVNGSTSTVDVYDDLKIRATSGGVNAETNEFTITVTDLPCAFNGPNIPNKVVTVGQSIPSFSGNFSCPSGTKYFKVGDWPAEINVNSNTGLVSGKATAVDTFSSLRIRASSNGSSVDSNSFSITVNNSPCTFYGPNIPNKVVTVSQSIPAFSGSFDCPSGSTYFKVGDWPDGINVNGNTGLVSGTAIAVGTFRNLSIRASSNSSSVDSNSFSITVNNSPCTFDGPNIPNKVVTVGQSIPSFSGNFGCPAGTTYVKVGNWPAGINVNSNTGLVSGTATAVDTFSSLRIRASSNGSSVDSNSFSITTKAVHECQDNELCLYSGANSTGESLVFDITDSETRGKWIYLSTTRYSATPSYDFWEMTSSVVNNSHFSITLSVEEGRVELNPQSEISFTGINDNSLNTLFIESSPVTTRCGTGEICLYDGPDFTGNSIIFSSTESVYTGEWIYLSTTRYSSGIRYDFFKITSSIINNSPHDIALGIAPAPTNTTLYPYPALSANSSEDWSNGNFDNALDAFLIRRLSN